MKKIISCMDVEMDYASHLMDAMNQKAGCPFMLRAFSAEETLVDYLQKEQCEILLISPELYTEEIRKNRPRCVFFLTDGREYEEPLEETVIYKYQKAELLLRRILSEYDASGGGSGDGKQTRFIGIYSPLHRIGKTTFALALGQELSCGESVLYLNLEGTSGFPAIFSQEYDMDLSDLIYYSAQEGISMKTKLPMIVRSLHRMDYVPPARISVDLIGIAEENWQNLLDQIAGTHLYDTVILDVGDGIQGFLEILSRCDQIYTPVARDLVSEGKLQQYDEMLEALEYTDVQAHTQKVELPQGDHTNGQSVYMGEFLWGPLAGYAKSIVEEALA